MSATAQSFRTSWAAVLARCQQRLRHLPLRLPQCQRNLSLLLCLPPLPLQLPPCPLLPLRRWRPRLLRPLRHSLGLLCPT